MVNKKNISEDQAKYAMLQGDFGDEVTLSNGRVVVLMTQDWCPQWADMKRWIYGVDAAEGIDVYELIYNQTGYFREFMKFKETVWKNDRIPYLRYYINGKLVKETNYVTKDEFIQIIK